MTIVTVGVPAAVAVAYVAVVWAGAPGKARSRLHERGETERAVAGCVRRVRAGCVGASLAVVSTTILLAAFMEPLADRVEPIGVAVVVCLAAAAICGATVLESLRVITGARSTGPRRIASLTRRGAASAVGADLLWWPWVLLVVSAGFVVAAAYQAVVPWWFAAVSLAVTVVTTTVATAALVLVTRSPARAHDLEHYAVVRAVDHDSELRLGEYVRNGGMLGVYFAYMLWAEAPGWKMLALVFATFLGLQLLARTAERRREARTRAAA